LVALQKSLSTGGCENQPHLTLQGPRRVNRRRFFEGQSEVVQDGQQRPKTEIHREASGSPLVAPPIMTLSALACGDSHGHPYSRRHSKGEISDRRQAKPANPVQDFGSNSLPCIAAVWRHGSCLLDCHSGAWAGCHARSSGSFRQRAIWPETGFRPHSSARRCGCPSRRSSTTKSGLILG
jgi:hypothetical protein